MDLSLCCSFTFHAVLRSKPPLFEVTLAFVGSGQQNEVGSLRSELVQGISNDLQVQDSISVQKQLWLCLTQQRLLSLNIWRTRHNKLTEKYLLSEYKKTDSTKPVPILWLMICLYTCLHYIVCLYFPYIKTCNQSSKSVYLRLVFKQELVSCQKILLLKQLHVLTKAFHIVNRICLQANM